MLEERIRGLLAGARAEARRQGLNAELLFHRERSSLVRLGNSSVSLCTSETLSRLDVSGDGCEKTTGRDVAVRANLISFTGVLADCQPPALFPPPRTGPRGLIFRFASL